MFYTVCLLKITMVSKCEYFLLKENKKMIVNALRTLACSALVVCKKCALT